ncbi:MAG: NADH:ubiquinone reductase (Na(+)-transporting) subunit C [Culturomica sp.]|jgi:Na+-transporting NADH:ubiquinone oxidoreductase subunit C|nr:NADH:ubiquinone reductase (Na(+)-transporting) subunit C [Culturomica sp.]
MNRQGNTYTFIYAVVLVVIVAALLAVVSLWLQPQQNENVENEKRRNILSAVKIEASAETSKELFDKYIIEQFAVNSKGEKITGDAFRTDMAQEFKKSCEERLLPVFVAQTDNGVKYILPLYGTGLWGPLWGYLSLDEDKNTVYGAVFAHKGETPGLGAEITTAPFSDQFVGKTIFDNEQLISILIKKGGNASGPHEVDAISGGTITSKGVEAMIRSYLSCYESFLKQK